MAFVNGKTKGYNINMSYINSMLEGYPAILPDSFDGNGGDDDGGQDVDSGPGQVGN